MPHAGILLCCGGVSERISKYLVKNVINTWTRGASIMPKHAYALPLLFVHTRGVLRTVFERIDISMSLKLSRLSSIAATGVIAFTLAMPGMASAQTAPAHGEAIAASVEVTNAEIDSLLASVGDTVDFNIHKYLGDPQPKDRLTGTEADAPAGGDLQPAEGVDFTVTPVTGIDLTTVDGWEQYANLDNTQTPEGNGLTTGNASVLTTNAQGLASSSLPVGVYYVTETKTPEGSTPIAPFYVALPLPADTATGSESWVDPVHVYPKNQPVTLEKTVSDRGVVAGETVHYTLNGSVPAVPANKKFDGYDIVDDYDETRVTPSLDTVQVSFEGGTGTLQRDTDYRIVESDGQFAVSFLEPGLQKLATQRDGNANLKVHIEFDAAVIGDAARGDATNDAILYPPNTASPDGTFRGEYDPNDPPETPEVPAEQVKTVLGQIDITKTDSESGAALSGAEFQLYRCQQGTTTTTDGPLTVNGTDTWTTNDQGKVTLPVIQVEDFYDNAQQTDEFDYCLVESKAPANYALNPEPISASVTADATLAAVTVENAPDDGMFRLPQTGAAGIIGLLLGGAGIAGVSTAMLRRNNKAEEA